MINLTFTGSAEEIRADMRKLLDASTSAPVVYDASSDTSRMTATEAAAVETVATGSRPARRGRPAKTAPATIEATATSVTVEPAQAISTGGERVDPDDAQAVADEAPEAPAPEAKTYTLDDVRNAAKPYIDKWTIAAAQTDLQEVLEAAAGVRAISKLNPADQGQLQRAVTAFEVASKAEARFVKKEG